MWKRTFSQRKNTQKKTNPQVRRKGERGQSFVELTLSLMFLLVLFSAVVDLGWAFFTMASLRDTAQEAATVGSICPTDFAKVKARLKEATSAPVDASLLLDNQLTFKIYRISGGVRTDICTYDSTHTANCPVASITPGDSMEVTIVYPHTIVTPFVGTFIGSQTYPITVTASSGIFSLVCSID